MSFQPSTPQNCAPRDALPSGPGSLEERNRVAAQGPERQDRSENDRLSPDTGYDFSPVQPSQQLADPRTKGLRQSVLCAGLVVLATAIFFLGLGRSPLFDPDEGRHAEIAREALETGNWITPTLNYQPYHHKPMPFYWLVGAGLWTFPGAPEWGARLPSAVAAVSTVLATACWAGALLGPTVGVLAGVVLATTAAFVVIGRTVLVDMSFTWWVTASHLALGWLALGGGPRLWWLPWLCVGIAMLLKGPAALVLLAGSTLFFCFATNKWAWLKDLRPARGLAIALVVGGSWYALAAVVAPTYIADFLWIHNVERFVSGTPGHPRNPLYYFYVLPAIFFPWSLWWPFAFSPIRSGLREREAVYLFLAGWAAVTVGFFTASSSKLPTYVLPALPPLAMLTAAGLARFLQSAPIPGWALFWAKSVHRALAISTGVVALVAWPMLRLWGEPELAVALTAVAVTAALVLAATWWLGPKGSIRYVVAVVTLASVSSELVYYFYGARLLASRYSLRDAALALSASPSDTTIASYKAGHNSLLFYSRRRIEVTEDVAEGARLLERDRPTVLLTKQVHLNEFLCAARVPLLVLWEGERDKVLLGNAAAAPPGRDDWRLPNACPPPTKPQASG